MPRRRYGQFCPVARALELVGDRWTLLLIRDLAFGPKRFTDLLDGLPGLTRTVLTTRLSDLQTAGIVHRTTLPPPAASTVYELTELGWGLKPVIAGLASWGMNVLGAPAPGERPRLGWYLAVMKSSFRPEAAAGIRETYEFRIEGDVFNVRVEDGTMELREGPAGEPHLVWSSDFRSFFLVGTRQVTPREAVASGMAETTGDPEVADRMIEILGRAAPREPV